MHDRMTVAFEIKRPWRDAPNESTLSIWPKGYRPTLVTIWHHDPRSGECGWSVPKLTKNQIERLRNYAWSESRNPYFMRRSGREWKGSRSAAEDMFRALLLQVAEVLGLPMTYEQAARTAACRIHYADAVDPCGFFVHEPGYHTNFTEDSERDRQDRFTGICCTIAAWHVLRPRRRWWKHPRWHLWHWRIQIHSVLHLKRWLFSRCATCGRGFSWGYAPTTGDWNGTGPRWFRGEQNVHHRDCQAIDAVTSGSSPA